MGQMILQSYEFYGMLLGWVVATVTGLLAFAFLKVTPAKIFLKAWLKKKPIAWVRYRTGIGEFRIGDDSDPGSMDVKGIGTVMLTENSYVREKCSGAAVFDTFSEYGTTISKEYSPIIHELKEKGFKINNFEDYKALVQLTQDEDYAAKYVEGMPSDEEKEEARKKIAELKELKIEIKPYKTYRVHELAYMFPNNISPVYVDAKVTNAVNRRMMKMRMDQKMWIYIGFGALLIVLAIVIVFKVIKQPEPQVIIKTIETGVVAAQTAASNMTI